MPTLSSTLSHSAEASSRRGRRAQNLGPVLGTQLLRACCPLLLMTAGPGPRLPLPPRSPKHASHLLVSFCCLRFLYPQSTPPALKRSSLWVPQPLRCAWSSARSCSGLYSQLALLAAGGVTLTRWMDRPEGDARKLPPKLSSLNPGGIPILLFTYTHKLRRRNSSGLPPPPWTVWLRCWTRGRGKAGSAEGRLPLRGTGTSPTQVSPRWNSGAEQTPACKITPPLSHQGPPRCHAAPLTPAYTPPCLLFSTPQPPAPCADTPSSSMGLARHTEPPSPIPWALPMCPPSQSKTFPYLSLLP